MVFSDAVFEVAAFAQNVFADAPPGPGSIEQPVM